MTTAKTVLDLVQSTTAYFERNGVESPRLNAEHLLAHALGRKRLDLYLEFDRPVPESDLDPLRELVRKRAQGVPLQHLLGTVEFLGRIFKVDSRALIPRPETERLVELLLESKIQNPKSRIADLGTGAGVIALSLAAELPEATVEALDISPDALALARENAEQLGLAGRVRFYQSDLLSAADGRFDLIAANLPYIATETLPQLSREVQHDPRMALDGGSDGADLIRRLIPQAAQHLNPGGLLALEIGHDQAAAISEDLRLAGYHGVTPASDYQGVTRFLLAKYG